MAQKQYLDKKVIISQIEANIAKAQAYVNQVPYALAEQRVRRIMANPCLSGRFYLNAIYKDVQCQDSESQAIRYRTTKQDEYKYSEIIKDNDVPAYIAAYKIIQKSKTDTTQAATQGNEKSTETVSQTVPYIFLGPYKNYTEAQSQFKSSKYYNSTSKQVDNSSKKELKFVGLLPQYHNINYTTRQTVIYQIYLDFSKKLKKLSDEYLQEYNSSKKQGSGDMSSNTDTQQNDDVGKYFLVENGVENFSKTMARSIYTQFQKSAYKDSGSVHKTLKDNRQEYPVEFFYNLTQHISQLVDNQLSIQERKVVEIYKKIQQLTQTTNKILKLIKENQQDGEYNYMTLNVNSLMNIIGGQRQSIVSKYNQAIQNGDTSLQSEIQSNALYNVFIKRNPNYLMDINQLLKKKNNLKLEINNLKSVYQQTQNIQDYKNLLEKTNEYNTIEQQYATLKNTNNNLTYNQWKAATDEYINRYKEYYEQTKTEAQDARSKQSVFIEDYVSSDNKIVLYNVLQPKTVAVYFDFKTLKSNFFKPQLDKQLARIKKEYGVQKIFKTDPDTGLLIKPLVQAGQKYPDDWPYKNLYIDTIKEHQWMKKVEQLTVLRDSYQLLPDKIPAPQAEDPSILQTFGSGVNTIVQMQPPADPWCDKYFPKNYAALFGVPDLLPSILTVEQLLFDDDKKPIMIPDPKGQKDKLGKIKMVQKTSKHPVSIQNGYAYVDTGVKVKLCYTILPLMPTSILIPGVGKDYGSLVAGYFTPMDPQAMEIVTKYPYQNDQVDGKVWWMMDDSAGVVFKVLTGQPPIMIKFKIYMKYNIPCGYPKKCGTLTNQQMELNGKCGLQDFLSKPIIIDTDGIGQASPRTGLTIPKQQSLLKSVVNSVESLTTGASNVLNMLDQTVTKNFNILTTNQQQGYLDIKQQAVQWKNNSKNLISNTWNIGKSLITNDQNKTSVLQNFTETMQDMLPSLTDLIPPECRYTVCEAQRKAQQDNCIESFSDGVINATKSAGLLANDMLKSTKDQLTNVAKGMGNLATTAAAGATNLAKTFNLYQLCSRRFNDYLKDANPLQDASPIPLLNKNGFKIPNKLDVFSQLQNTLTKDVLGGFVGMLNNCITKNATKLQIMDSPLIPSNIKQILYINNEVGNILQMNKVLQGQGTSLNAIIQKMNASSLNPFSNVNDSLNNVAGTGLSVDQIFSNANNAVVNLNGVKTSVATLNSTALSSNIIQNAIKTGGVDIANAIQSNNKTDLSGGITDLDIVAKNVADTSNFSYAKQTIYGALSDNAKKISSLDTTSNYGANTTFMDITAKVQSDNLKWVAETSDTINAGIAVTEIVDDMSKWKNTSNILAGLGDISTIITSKMLQKTLRKAADKAEEQMSANMNQLQNMNLYIKAKQDQLTRINTGK